MPRLSFLISLYLPICKMFKINKLDTKLLKEEWDFDLNYSDDPISDSPYWLNHQILFKPLLLFACVNTMYFFFFFWMQFYEERFLELQRIAQAFYLFTQNLNLDWGSSYLYILLKKLVTLNCLKRNTAFLKWTTYT